jgi:nitrate reductase gamma subunit
MTALLYISLYASVACFVIGCVRRMRQYASLPVHLRWELYPVPHEPPERAKHGGSYFEESEWWTKPRRIDHLGDLRVMLSEILLFKSVKESNPNLWWRSLLFHSGLYCIVASGTLHLAIASGWRVVGTAWTDVFSRLATTLGWIGLPLVFLGALALLLRRISHLESRDYTHPADYIHLSVIASAAVFLFIGATLQAAPNALLLLTGALTFHTALHVPGLLAAGLFLTFALLAYIPFSQMGHFIAKYFTFHTIRWDDAPNRGGRFAKQINTSLAYRPTWSAKHINADGTKTWAEIATTNPTTEARK